MDTYRELPVADRDSSSNIDEERELNLPKREGAHRKFVLGFTVVGIVALVCCALGSWIRWRLWKFDPGAATQEFQFSIGTGGHTHVGGVLYEDLLRRAPRKNDFHLTLEQALRVASIRELRQSDFENGTFIIKKAGVYKLMENVEFAPNKGQGYMPLKDESPYTYDKGFWLGFFAAIVVDSSNVLIDLNGKHISMSEEFWLRQRFFFSAIELSSKPTRSKNGPGMFGYDHDKVSAAWGVTIFNGDLGLSSHSGIHGIGNDGVWIDKVRIHEFEVSGISLIGASNIHLSNIVIGPSQGSRESYYKVPAPFSFSIAQFMVNVIRTANIPWQSEFGELQTDIETFIDDAATGNAARSDTFFGRAISSFAGLPDAGSIYGIHIFQKLPSANDLDAFAPPEEDQVQSRSKVLTVNNVLIRSLDIKEEEVVKMVWQQETASTPEMVISKPGYHPTHVTGMLGETFTGVGAARPDGTYRGNVLSNAQVALQKLSVKALISEKVMYGATKTTSGVLDWAEGHGTLNDLVRSGITYVCGRDAMGHRGRGAVGMRVHAMTDVIIQNVQIIDVKNSGPINANISHCPPKDNANTGADAIGISLSNVAQCRGVNVNITALESLAGSAIGVDAREHDNTVSFNGLNVSKIRGLGATAPYLASAGTKDFSVSST